jgi:hypothetical protein
MIYYASQQYINYIMMVSFIVGGNRSIQRKPPTCHKALTNFNVVSSTTCLNGIPTSAVSIIKNRQVLHTSSSYQIIVSNHVLLFAFLEGGVWKMNVTNYFFN